MAAGPRRRERTADELVIRRLFQEHGGALIRYAERLMGDRALGEDVVQETLVRAWRNTDALTGSKGSVRGYLFTIARHVAIDRHRARRVRPAEVAATDRTAPIVPDHADAVVDSMVVLDALDRLSPAHREVLLQIYYRGRSVEEAAAALGVPAGTVKSRCYYALRRLREAITGAPRRAATPVATAAESTAV